MRGFTAPLADHVVLTGVAATGIVQIHELGWRSQYARIVAFSLELPEMSMAPNIRALKRKKSLAEKVILQATARALEDKYQVPVVPLQQLKEVMTNHGIFWEEMK